MANDNLPPWLHTLLQAECYPHPAPDIRLVQTHISYVLLVGDFVYKFKKPVNFGFLDFSAADRRHHYCEQELLLNRRLCPDIYLGLVEVTEENGGFALNGSGRPVEWGVRMRRMPEERMMVNLIRTGGLLAEHIDALVEVLADFYSRAESGEAVRQFGTAEAVAVNVLENFEQTRPFLGQGGLDEARFDRIAIAARDFLDRRDLFRNSGSTKAVSATVTATSTRPTSVWPTRSISTTASSSMSGSASATWPAPLPFSPWIWISTDWKHCRSVSSTALSPGPMIRAC